MLSLSNSAANPNPTILGKGASLVVPRSAPERPTSSVTPTGERAFGLLSGAENSRGRSGIDSIGIQNDNPANQVETRKIARNANGLPPAAQAWVLLQKYLVDFSRAVPLFEEEALTAAYRSALSDYQQVSSLDLTVAYVTLAIAYHLRTLSPFASPTDDENVHAYLRKASIALPDVLLSPPTLISGQCLTAMALLINLVPDSQPITNLSVTALRMMLEIIRARSNLLDLNKDGQQLRRVFWIALSTDVDAAIRSGQWTSLTFYGPEIDLPLQQTADRLGLINLGDSPFYIFHHRANLAQIQLRLLQILGVQNSLQNQQAIAISTRTLAVDLIAWRLQEPRLQALLEAPLCSLRHSDAVHLLALEASYFNTFFTIQSLREDIGPFNGSILVHLQRYSSLSFSDYITEARQLLKSFNRLAQGDLAMARLVVEAVTSALYIALNFMICNPAATTTRQDTELTAAPLRVIVEMSQKDGQEVLVTALKTILLKVCERYNRQLRDPDSPFDTEDLSFITWATTST